MQVLNIKIQGQEIYWENSFPIVSGSQGYLYCNFKYNNDWDNSVKKIRFYNPQSKKKYYDVENPAELVLIPKEVVTGDCFYITVGGFKGDTFIPTAALRIPLQKNEYEEPDDEDIDLEDVEEALKEIEELADRCEGLYEQLLISETERQEEFNKFVPLIGENGNWFIYNPKTKEYEDSGKSSIGTTNKVDYGEI